MLDESIDQDGVICGALVEEPEEAGLAPGSSPAILDLECADCVAPGHCIVVPMKKTSCPPSRDSVCRFGTGIKPLAAVLFDSKESYALNPAMKP